MASTAHSHLSATAPARLRYCAQPPRLARALPAGTDAGRASAIITFSKKWVAGTDLSYYCFRSGDGSPGDWQGNLADMDAVRHAFQEWHNLGVGVGFHEVPNAADATIRIGFEPAGGSWSYVGRDALTIKDRAARTMNFGWPLDTPYGHDTALHEIGHALGLEHEHQNPFAGIEWDEPAVRSYFKGDPNFWDDAQINHNIIDKIAPASVKGTTWDPDSVMEYEFGPGLIRKPDDYRVKGLKPRGGLSPADVKWMRTAYPPVTEALPQLKLEIARKLQLAPGQTTLFEFKPPEDRSYTVGTAGDCDTVLVLFEVKAAGNVQVAADDDGGERRNAKISARLRAGATYQVGLRLYYSEPESRTSLMVW